MRLLQQGLVVDSGAERSAAERRGNPTQRRLRAVLAEDDDLQGRELRRSLRPRGFPDRGVAEQPPVLPGVGRHTRRESVRHRRHVLCHAHRECLESEQIRHILGRVSPPNICITAPVNTTIQTTAKTTTMIMTVLERFVPASKARRGTWIER